MSLETTTTLEPKTISHLQTLARLNIDSRDGFQYAIERLPSEAKAIRSLFQDAAAQRERQLAELNKYVSLNDEVSSDQGSFAAAFHRAVIALRDSFTGEHDAYSVLAEAERGEDAIKGAYEDALKETAGSAVTDVLNHQYAAVKQMHDKVRALRDSAKS